MHTSMIEKHDVVDKTKIKIDRNCRVFWTNGIVPSDTILFVSIFVFLNFFNKENWLNYSIKHEIQSSKRSKLCVHIMSLFDYKHKVVSDKKVDSKTKFDLTIIQKKDRVRLSFGFRHPTYPKLCGNHVTCSLWNLKWEGPHQDRESSEILLKFWYADPSLHQNKN